MLKEPFYNTDSIFRRNRAVPRVSKSVTFSFGMKSSKEIMKSQLNFEITRMRQTIKAIENGKGDVATAIDNVSEHVHKEISAAEEIAKSADLIEHRRMARVLGKAVRVLGKYEDALRDLSTELFSDTLDVILCVQKEQSARRASRSDGDAISVGGSVSGVGSCLVSPSEAGELPAFTSDGSTNSLAQQSDVQVNSNTIGVADTKSIKDTAATVQQNQVQGQGNDDGPPDYPPAAQSDSPRKRIIVDEHSTGRMWKIRESELLTLAKRQRCEVSHIDSPSLFWIRPSDTAYHTVRGAVNDEFRLVGSCAVRKAKVGDYCAAQIGELYERAKILEIQHVTFGKSLAKLLFVDIGLVGYNELHLLRILPSVLCQLPRQAIPCVLAEVAPKSGLWSHQAVRQFTKLCSTNAESHLEVDAVGIADKNNGINTVQLYQMSGGVEENVSHRLVNQQNDLCRVPTMIPMGWYGKENESATNNE